MRKSQCYILHESLQYFLIANIYILYYHNLHTVPVKIFIIGVTKKSILTILSS